MFHHTENYLPEQPGLPLEVSQATELKNKLLYYKRRLTPWTLNPFIRSPFALATLVTSVLSSFWMYELILRNLAKLPPEIFILPIFEEPSHQFVDKGVIPYIVLIKNIPVLLMVALALFLSQRNFHYLSQYLLIIAMISDLLLFTILYVYLSRLI